MKSKLKSNFNHRFGDIAKYIYYYEKGYNHLSSKEIIYKFHISASTLTKFVRHMGFESFQAMCTQLYIFSNLQAPRKNNFIYDHLLLEQQKESYLKMYKNLKQKKSTVIIHSNEYKNMAQELCDRYNNYSGKGFIYENSIDINKIPKTEYVIIFGLLNIELTKYLLENQISTTIIGYTNEANEVSFRVDSIYFSYILFEREAFDKKQNVVFLLIFLFSDLDIYI